MERELKYKYRENISATVVTNVPIFKIRSICSNRLTIVRGVAPDEIPSLSPRSLSTRSRIIIGDHFRSRSPRRCAGTLVNPSLFYSSKSGYESMERAQQFAKCLWRDRMDKTCPAVTGEAGAIGAYPDTRTNWSSRDFYSNSPPTPGPIFARNSALPYANEFCNSGMHACFGRVCTPCLL